MKRKHILPRAVLFSFLMILYFVSTLNIITGCGGSSESGPSPDEGVAGISGTAGTDGSAGASGASSGGTSGGTGGGGGNSDASLRNDSPASLLTGGTFLRWTLKLSGSTVSSVQLSSFTNDKGILPPLDGDYAVILSHGDTQVAAYPFYFNGKVLKENFNASGEATAAEEQTLTGDLLATIIIKADEPIDKLSVMAPDGTVVLQTNTFTDGSSLAGLSTSPSQASSLTAIPEFPWMHFITTDASVDGAYISSIENWQGVSTVVDVPEFDKNRILAQLRHASRLTQSAVTHIGFANPDPSDNEWAAMTSGSIIVVNALRLSLAGGGSVPDTTMAHEAAHAYNHLLDHPASTGSESRWSAAVRTLAAQRIEDLGFNQRFSTFWRTSLHGPAVSAGLSVPYAGSYVTGGGGPSATDLRNGFSRSYGRSNEREDIATFVDEVQWHPDGPVCNNIKVAEGSRVNKYLALPYAKILMLQYAGFIDADKAEACFGNTILQANQEGIVFTRYDDVQVPFTGNPTAGYINNGDYLSISATGPGTYTIMAEVKTRRPRVPPIGVFRLQNISLNDINSPSTKYALFIGNNAPIYVRTSYSGLMVVTGVTSTPPRVEGFFINVLARNYEGTITDFWPFGTFFYDPTHAGHQQRFPW